jgi:hypothetical protein
MSEPEVIYVDLNELQTQIIGAWTESLAGEGVAFDPILSNVHPTVDEMRAIIFELLDFYAPNLIGGLPLDLIRFYTLSLRQGVEIAVAVKALLLAPFYGDAIHLVTRIRNRQVINDTTIH